ncbi:TPA: restriction endonuclease subunit S [Vibrio vulnificus]|nr:restriction endonuclease subunit S [Vibrio vulnificus]
MNSEWPLHSLSDFINVKHGFAFKGEFFKAERTSDLLVTPGNFAIGGGFKSDKFKFYDGPVPEDYVLSEGDLIVTMTDLSKQADTLGYSALVPAIAGSRLLHNQRVGLVEFKNDELDITYLYFLLRSKEYRHHVVSTATGSTVKHTSPTKILSFAFRKPPKDIQIDIGKKLIALEEKIENNTQTNQTLEQIAQAIFKSWFVDFDPVKAKIEALAAGGSADDAELAAMSVISAKTLDELNSLKASNPDAFNKLAQTAALFPKDLDSETGTPAGWNSGVIADIAKLNANSWTKKNRPEQVHYVDLSNTKNGRIETVTTYGFDEAPSRARRILNSGDTIIGTVRPGNRAFAFIGETEKPLTGSTGFAVLSPKEEFWTSFVYLATTNDDAIDEYARLADGGAYPAIKPEVVADTPCVLPTKDIAQKFWQLTGAMLKKAHQARLENEELAKTRDTLLPKLLSGEINVTSEVVE